jgi:Holliday junction resolvase RusA-like endonuclease
MAAPLTFTVIVPGEPIAQGRPRGFYKPGLGVRMYDPAKSRSWKGAAQVHYREALERAGLQAPAFPDGAVELHVLAVFTCPLSKHRKRDPIGRQPHTGNKDADNIGKACADAANGILWADDRQVARLVVEKIVGAQGEAPRVEMTVQAYYVKPDSDNGTLWQVRG